jgi:hypothetical protein
VSFASVGSSIWLESITVSYINISSLWWLVGCECRSVHVGICALVDPPGLKGCGLGMDRNLPGGSMFVDGYVWICCYHITSWAGVSWHCYRLSYVWFSGRKIRVD